MTDGSDRRLNLSGGTVEETVFRGGTAARWLPRVLAAAVLVAALLAAYRFDPTDVLLASRYLRRGVAVVGAVLAWWILRKGTEARAVLALRAEELVFRYGAREYSLRHEDVDRLGYETPFAQSRPWLPALVLRDRFGQPWRISGLIDDGDKLLGELLRRTGRNDLQAWAETLNLQGVMARARRRVLIGYLVAAAIVVAGIVYYLH
jgi:hypothetical protein